jgi:hypothetical protein
LNCSGTPVTNGFAVIHYNNETRYSDATGANGEFATTFTTCAGMPTSYEIYGIDATAQQSGATINAAVTSPTTNAGDIAACGTASLQYINYNIDGVNQGYSSLVAGDQFSGNSYDSTNAHGAYIVGHNSANQGITFQFNNNGTTGTYPLGYLSFYGTAGNTTLIQPFTVTVTNYPQSAGNYFEGSFAGLYMDASGVTHTISCSFRVRRQ